MRKLFLFIAAGLILSSCGKPCSVIWTEGETEPGVNTAVHKMQVVNPPAGTGWRIWYCQFGSSMEMLEGSQGRIRQICGTLFLVTPDIDAKGDTLTIIYRSRAFANHGRAPEGFYLEKKGERPVPLGIIRNFVPCEPVRSFEYSHVATSVTDMIPQLKKVTPSGDGTTRINFNSEASIVDGQVPGWYRISLDGSTKVEAADADGAYWASVTLENIVRNAEGDPVQNMVIEDWPDLGHRGVMLDVSRNFTTKENLLKFIDLLAHYKANVLHLHFGDDEGWRVAIDALPELTGYGAYRGIPVLNEDGSISEPAALMPSYCGSIDRNDITSPANGFYTHEEFVEILRYAIDRHIHVIPEFDIPGHSRAAIKSMEKRLERTGDASFMLSDPEDSSIYKSAQDFTDNVIDVAMESTYRFIETVFDGLIGMYAEAGVPLDAIHIGGDEVPEGAWTGSPACRKMMKDNGWEDIALLKDYFMNRVLDIAADRGVKIAGWQEVAQHLEPRTSEKLKEWLHYANVWSVSKGQDQVAYELANNGVNVVLSNAPNAYLDFAYNDSRTERGYNWGGYVDERRAFSLLPYNIYRSVRWDDSRKIADIASAAEGKETLTDDGRVHVIGVQGQLWGETLRSFDHVTYYTFPKVLGLIERGWNADPSWSATTVSDAPEFMEAFDKFYSIIVDKEMPYYDETGISYHKN